MTRKLTLLVAAVGTAGIAGAAVVSTLPEAGAIFSLTASRNTPSAPAKANREAACQAFVKHFSDNLGVSTSQTSAAYKKAVDQAIDDAVKAGRISAAQGAALKARLDKQPLCAGFHIRGGEGILGEARSAYLDAAAGALHVSSTQLKTDLRNGQSLSQVAKAQGVSESQFRQSLITALRPKLDAAVAAHELTAAQRDKIIERLQSGPLPLWNRPDRHGFGRPNGAPNTSTAAPAV